MVTYTLAKTIWVTPIPALPWTTAVIGTKSAKAYDFSCAYVGEGLMGSPLAVSSVRNELWYTRTHRRAYTGVGTLTYLGVGISATQRRASLTGRPAPQVGSGCPPLTLWSIPLSPHHIQGCSHPLQVESAGSFLSQERGKWVRAGTLCKWYLLMRRGTSQKWSWMVDFVLFGWFLVELRWHWF